MKMKKNGLGGRHPLEQIPQPQTATAADGTHPTGMHSCLIGHFLVFRARAASTRGFQKGQGVNWMEFSPR